MNSFGLGFTMKVNLGAKNNIILIKNDRKKKYWIVVPAIKLKYNKDEKGFCWGYFKEVLSVSRGNL